MTMDNHHGDRVVAWLGDLMGEICRMKNSCIGAVIISLMPVE